jgi:aspartate aminotransferase
MLLSSRVKGVSDSITQSLNEKAQQLQDEGLVIYNLSAGQLPIKPPQSFIEKIQAHLNFLKSYQYSPVAGLAELRKKILDYHCEKRNISSESLDVIVSNGSKQSIYFALGAILDPGDEIVILAPYWVSYPEMIKFWGGTPITIKSNVFDAFFPQIEDIVKVLTPRTKAIIINSPNNPAGVHYSESWMKNLAQVLKDYPDVWILSDEVYADLVYFDPAPRFIYQVAPELMDRCITFGAISKSLASTGLRLGWTVAPQTVVGAMTRIQGQATSGPSSLIQRALLDFDFLEIDKFLLPVKVHLRKSAQLVRDTFKEKNLQNLWYQSHSAFYFMLDFSRTPMFQRFQGQSPDGDYSSQICQEILEQKGVVLVPGSDFGLPNTARMSLTMEEVPFQEALERLTSYLNQV